MSKDWYLDMVDFHNVVMEDTFEVGPKVPSTKYKRLRQILITEEVKETLEALRQNDITKLADGIVDSIVVLLGTAITYGIDIRPIWDEIHKTNMAKADGPMREDGKRLKPDDWEPPRVEELLDEQKEGSPPAVMCEFCANLIPGLCGKNNRCPAFVSKDHGA